MKTLTHEQARRVYDRIGAKQDTQAFYEDRATSILLEHGDFTSAHHVFELGCGTGRFAAKLLGTYLHSTACYHGVDVSPRMVELATARLAAFGDRAEVVLTDGSPPRAEPQAAYDRFVSNFVLDLLSDDNIAAVLKEAHRMLEPGGLLCLASLSTGAGGLGRVMARLWSGVHRLSPALVGGCRPLDLAGNLLPARWRIRHHARLVPFGIPSEAVVAERV